ncbi:hypothetical protein F4695_000567 [Rhizobium soli]|uniref:KAP NTPase domain-containing protein n=1 Tax=Rhizobium soli TaxID=424798 RepID=A0A7X0JGP1_9HYPH|nr:P-loop NTPase fold protein [Rhizobium soli]MBB6507248.1 hypothetical protein [Rhizobium soli]
MASDYWRDKNDLLGRQVEADHVIKFVNQRVADRIRRGLPGSFVLNIDAKWGEGKTFFVNGVRSELEANGHPAILIDAWRDDFSGDPLTAVVAEFDRFLDQYKSKDRSVRVRVAAAGKNVRRNAGKLSLLMGKGVAKRVSHYVVGEVSEEIAGLISNVVPADVNTKTTIDDASSAVLEMSNTAIDKYAANKLKQFSEAKVSLANFRQSLEQAVKALAAGGLKPPFFILIDELDRCRPTYAIEMLERIKHLFDAKNVVFILSTDTAQLSNAIRAVYGNDFDSRHYLTRFFDRSYMLASPDRRQMIKWLVANSDMDPQKIRTDTDLSVVQIVDSVSDHYKLDLRQMDKAVDLLATIATVWDSNAQVEIALIYPMIAAFLSGNPLSNPQQIWNAFHYESSPKNFAPLHISKVNIGAVFEKVFSWRTVSLGQIVNEISSDYNAVHNGPQPTRIAYKIIQSEIDAVRVGDAMPAISSYADRVRMAGRFRSAVV